MLDISVNSKVKKSLSQNVLLSIVELEFLICLIFQASNKCCSILLGHLEQDKDCQDFVVAEFS